MRFYISNELPGDAVAAGPWTTLWVTMTWSTIGEQNVHTHGHDESRRVPVWWRLEGTWDRSQRLLTWVPAQRRILQAIRSLWPQPASQKYWPLLSRLPLAAAFLGQARLELSEKGQVQSYWLTQKFRQHHESRAWVCGCTQVPSSSAGQHQRPFPWSRPSDQPLGKEVLWDTLDSIPSPPQPHHFYSLSEVRASP